MIFWPKKTKHACVWTLYFKGFLLMPITHNLNVIIIINHIAVVIIIIIIFIITKINIYLN